jgi:hypothetical protein
MRFMMIVKADANTEAYVMPDPEIFKAMGDLNEEMVNAGVLLAGDGLHPSSKGARVYYSDGKRTVVDGPFAETKELIAGYWIIQVKSKQEAIDWAMKVPMPANYKGETNIELRQIFESEDFPSDAFTPEEAAREAVLRERIQQQHG